MKLAWILAAVAFALFSAAWIIGGIDVSSGDVLVLTLGLAYSVVGSLIASRHPRNAMGWLFLGIGVTTGLGAVAGSYADAWLDGGGGPQALGELAAVYGTASWIPFILVPSTFVLLLFPDGRLPSRRWRWVAWCAGLGIAGVFVGVLLNPGPLEDYPQLDNPLGVTSTAVDALTGLSVALLLAGLVGSAAAVIVRFRRAQGERRAQLKWLALAGAVAALMLPIAILGSDLWGNAGTNVICMVAVLGLPVAAGIAILRHRLYDIDVVINRALVYGAVTALLATAYLVCVLLLQLALSPLTADSGLAIAASTLAVAAMFRPLRARIQAAVDRRFYRRRYDAAQTLAAFAGNLRHELDLDALDAELRAVVADTMQPAHVTLWLRVPR